MKQWKINTVALSSSRIAAATVEGRSCGNRRSLILKRPSTVASACALAAQGYGNVDI
jgi:hypothetical protein